MKTKRIEWFHTLTFFYYKTAKGYCYRYNKILEETERISLKEYEEQRALAKQEYDKFMAETHKMSESYYKHYGEERQRK